MAYFFGQIVRRNWLTLVVGATLGLAVGIGYVMLTPPSYEASSTLAANSQGRVPTYIELAKTSSVTKPVSLKTGLTESEVIARVVVTQRLATSLVTVTAAAPDPEMAVTLAKAFSRSLVEQVQDLELAPGDSSSDAYIKIAQPASAVDVTSSNGVRLLTVLGFFAIGVLLGLLTVYWRTRNGLPLRNRVDVRQLVGLPVLVDVVPDNMLSERPGGEPASELGSDVDDDAHNSVAARMRSLLLDDARLVGLVHPSSGFKSYCFARQLAATLSSRQRVLLLEANLLTEEVDGDGLALGLSDVLVGKAQLADVISLDESGLFRTIPAGAPIVSATAMLGSVAFHDVLLSLRRDFDLILVNFPGVSSWDELEALPEMDASMILVISKYVTTDREALDAIRQIKDRGQSLHLVSIV